MDKDGRIAKYTLPPVDYVLPPLPEDSWYDYGQLLEYCGFMLDDVYSDDLIRFWFTRNATCDTEPYYKPEYCAAVRKLLRDLSKYNNLEISPLWQHVADLPDWSMMNVFDKLMFMAWD